MRMGVVDALFTVWERGGPEWWRNLVFWLALHIYGRRRFVQTIRDYNERNR